MSQNSGYNRTTFYSMIFFLTKIKAKSDALCKWLLCPFLTLYFSYIKDYRGTIEVKQAIFETIQNLYIKGKSAGKPLTKN